MDECDIRERSSCRARFEKRYFCFLKGAYGQKVLALRARVAMCVPRDRGCCETLVRTWTQQGRSNSQPSPQSNTNPTGCSDKCFHLQLFSGDSERRQHTVWTRCSKECGSRYKQHRSSPRRLTRILFSFWSGPLNRDNGAKGWEPAADKHVLKQWCTHTKREWKEAAACLWAPLSDLFCVSSDHARMLSPAPFTHH